MRTSISNTILRPNSCKILLFIYLFLLNKSPLFEKSDPDLKRGVINTRFLNSENFDFLPKNQQKKPKNFPAAKPRIFPKKGGGY